MSGRSIDDRVPNFSDLRIGVGIGARYYTNFGPMRVDVATPLDRRDGREPDQRLRLDRAGLLMARRRHRRRDIPARSRAVERRGDVTGRRGSRSWRWVIWRLIALVGTAADRGIDTEPGRRFVANQIESLEFENGMKIDIDRIDGSLYGEMTIRDLTLSDPKGEFLRAPKVEVDWRPFNYLRNHVDIRSLTRATDDAARLPAFTRHAAERRAAAARHRHRCRPIARSTG